MDIAVLAVIISGVVSVVTIVCNVILTIRIKRIESNGDIENALYKISYDEYVHRSNLILERADKEGGTASIVPYSEYLVFYSKLISALRSKHYSKARYEKAVNEAYDIIVMMRDKIENRKFN